jgi:hypothetical protein
MVISKYGDKIACNFKNISKFYGLLQMLHSILVMHMQRGIVLFLKLFGVIKYYKDNKEDAILRIMLLFFSLWIGLSKVRPQKLCVTLLSLCLNLNSGGGWKPEVMSWCQH